MESISDHELEARLAAADPVDRRVLADARVEASLNALHSALLSRDALAHQPFSAPQWVHTTHKRAEKERSRRPMAVRSRRRLITVAATALAVTAATLIGVGAFSGGAGTTPGFPLSVSSAQAAQLDRIASAAAQIAGPGRGQWLFQRLEISETGGEQPSGHSPWVNWYDTRDVEEWQNQFAVERTRSTYTSARFTSAASRATYLAERPRFLANGQSGSPLPTGTTDEADPSCATSPSGAATLPRTTVGLVNRLRREGAESMWAQLDMILAQSTSAQQRAAALGALKYVPGIRVLGTQRDTDGRSGLAVTVTGGNDTIIVDPSTGNLLQDAVRVTESVGGLRAGAVVMQTVYLQRSIVNSMTALPGGGTRPYHGPSPFEVHCDAPTKR